MKFIVLDSFKAQTAQGDKEILAGQVINLQKDKAGKLISAGRIKLIMDMLNEEYQVLITWLKQYDVTGADIKGSATELTDQIQTAIKEMDNFMIDEDLQGFRESILKVKKLYLQAASKSENYENTGDIESSASENKWGNCR